MPINDLKKIRQMAEESWLSCSDRGSLSKKVWINVFMTGLFSSNLIEIDSKERLEIHGQLTKRLIDSQKDIPSEFNQIISDNFFDLT
jgi:hypothetical protein